MVEKLKKVSKALSKASRLHKQQSETFIKYVKYTYIIYLYIYSIIILHRLDINHIMIYHQ